MLTSVRTGELVKVKERIALTMRTATLIVYDRSGSRLPPFAFGRVEHTSKPRDFNDIPGHDTRTLHHNNSKTASICGI